MIGTEVIVEGGHRLDVFEGLDFSFNYSVSDIREPDKRQTEYTKTIKCPGTSTHTSLRHSGNFSMLLDPVIQTYSIYSAGKSM